MADTTTQPEAPVDEPKTAEEAPSEEPKIEFTPEQQAAIDRIVAERVKRAEGIAAKRAQQEAEEAARRAQMDETERLKAEKADAEKRAEEAMTQATKVLVNAEARIAAAAAGAKPERIDRILRLLDLDDVTAEDGKVDTEAISAAVKALKAEVPELFGPAQPPARSGGDMSGSGGDKRTWTRAQVAELAKDPKKYAEHREEINAAMRDGRIV